MNSWWVRSERKIGRETEDLGLITLCLQDGKAEVECQRRLAKRGNIHTNTEAHRDAEGLQPHIVVDGAGINECHKIKELAHQRLLLLDNIEDPQNVGAILRSAEVFGFNGVCLPNRGVPEVYPSIVKVSAGATEFMQIARQFSANQYARKAAEEGYQIAALDMNGNTTLEAVRTAAPEKLMLTIGGEDKSVGQFILNMADHTIGIPQFGRVNSLNASVAAGIVMHALDGNVTAQA